MQLSRVMLRVFQFSLGGSLLLLILSGVLMWWVESPGILVYFGFLAMGHAFIAYQCARLRDAHRWRKWMMSGLMAAGVSLILWSWVIMTLEQGAGLDNWFGGTRSGREIQKTLGAEVGVWLGFPISGWALFAGVAGMLRGPRLSSGGARALRVLTLLAGGATVLIAVGGGWFLHGLSGHTSGHDMVDWIALTLRIGGVPAVLFGCGSLGCLIGSALSREGEDEAPEEVRKAFTLRCPRCSERQAMKTHGDQCSSCGLRVKVIPR